MKCDDGVGVQLDSGREANEMSGDFKWRHFMGEIILWAVRWYCKYGVSYRDLEEMNGRAWR
jgi:transposase-like protein